MLYIIPTPMPRKFYSVVQRDASSPPVQEKAVEEGFHSLRQASILISITYSPPSLLVCVFPSRKQNHLGFRLSLSDRIRHLDRLCTFCFELLEHCLAIAFHDSSLFKVLDLSPISGHSGLPNRANRAHTQLPTHSFSNATSWILQLVWAAEDSLIGSKMLLRSRHWKKPSLASQQRARCNRLGAMPSPDDEGEDEEEEEEGDEDPEPNQPIVCLGDGLKRIVL